MRDFVIITQLHGHTLTVPLYFVSQTLSAAEFQQSREKPKFVFFGRVGVITPTNSMLLTTPMLIALMYKVGT